MFRISTGTKTETNPKGTGYKIDEDITDTDKNTEEVNKKHREQAKKYAETLEAYEKQFNIVNVKDFDKNLKALSITYEDTEQDLEGVNQEQEKNVKNTEKQKTALENLKKSYKEYENLADRLIRNDNLKADDPLLGDLKQTTADLQTLKQQYETIGGQFDFAGFIDNEDTQAAVKHLIELLGQIGEKAKKETAQGKEQLAKLKKESFKETEEDINKNKGTGEKLIKGLDFKKAIKDGTELLGTVGQIASGIQALTNIPRIFHDEDLSAGEKILQIIMAFAVGAPQVAQLGGLINKLSGALLESSISASFAAGGFSAAAASVGALLAELAPFIAIAAVVGFAINGIVKAYNSEKDAAEQAAQAARDVASANQEIQDSLNKMQSAFDAYDTAVEKLENCVEGTQE